MSAILAGFLFYTSTVLAVPMVSSSNGWATASCGFDGYHTNCWSRDVNSHWDADERWGVPQLKNPYAMASQGQHHCAVDEGKLKCWGTNLFPIDKPFANPHSLTVARQHFCIVDEGKIRCVRALDSPLPQSPDWRDVESVRVSDRLGCALTQGRIRCWGPEAREAEPAWVGVIDFTLTASWLCGLTKTAVQCRRHSDGAPYPWALPQDLKNPSKLAVEDWGGQVGCVIDEGRARCWGGVGFDGQRVVDIKAIRNRYGVCAITFENRVICGSSEVLPQLPAGGYRLATVSQVNNFLLVCAANGSDVRCTDYSKYPESGSLQFNRDFLEPNTIQEGEIYDYRGDRIDETGCRIARNQVECLGQFATFTWPNVGEVRALQASRSEFALLTAEGRVGGVRVGLSEQQWFEKLPVFNWYAGGEQVTALACSYQKGCAVDKNSRSLAMSETGNRCLIDSESKIVCSSHVKIPTLTSKPIELAFVREELFVLTDAGIISMTGTLAGNFSSLAGAPVVHEASRGLIVLPRGEPWVPPRGSGQESNLSSLLHYWGAISYGIEREFVGELVSRFRSFFLYPTAGHKKHLFPVVNYLESSSPWTKDINFSSWKSTWDIQTYAADFKLTECVTAQTGETKHLERRLVLLVLRSLLGSSLRYVSVKKQGLFNRLLPALESEINSQHNCLELAQFFNTIRPELRTIKEALNESVLVRHRTQFVETIERAFPNYLKEN